MKSRVWRQAQLCVSEPTIFHLQADSHTLDAHTYTLRGCFLFTSKMNIKFRLKKTVTFLPPKHLPFVLFPDVVFFWEVNEVNHWLRGQKQVFVQHFDLRQRHTRQAADNPNFPTKLLKADQTETNGAKSNSLVFIFRGVRLLNVLTKISMAWCHYF